jgi:hypothetical protein
MSWAGLASNQTISFNNLQNGVDTGQFTAKTSIPVSDEQITKTDANTYVNIDTAYAPYSSKASNQLVVKSDLITTTTTTTTTTAAPTTTTTTVAFFTYEFDTTSYVNGNDACNSFIYLINAFASTSAAGSVSRFFTDSGLTTPYNGNGNYYAWSYDGINYYTGQIDGSGFTSSVSLCP